MEIRALKEGYRVKHPQPKNDVLPSLPCRLCAYGPGSSGKTNALVTMITDPRFYGGKNTVWDKIFWCSPTATIDPALDPLREFVHDNLSQDQSSEPTFHDGLPIPFLEAQVQKARKVSEFLKKSKAKQQGFNILICIDDLADTKGDPAAQRFVNACFVKYRHWGVSTILSSQRVKLPLISPTVRVNATGVLCWRLRSHSDLWENFVYEYSALCSKEQLYAAYKAAVEIPYNFLYINCLAKDIDHMFYSGFTHRFLMSGTGE